MYQDAAPGAGLHALNEASPIPVDGLTVAIDKLDSLTNHAYQIAETAGAHADRILGSRPEAEGKGGPTALRCGALGELHNQIDRLENALQRLDEQSRRFNAI